MTREREKDDPIIPSWDGEGSGWADYSRRVRLAHSQTPVGKRYTNLGSKPVLKLRGKAWEIAASIDHEALSRDSGAQYLLAFLKERLGKLPIPDIGQHLDELFVRLKRNPGADLVSWSNQLREAYRKLQRSLARTRAGKKHQSTQTEEEVDKKHQSGLSDVDGPPPTSSAKRRQSMSEPQREPYHAFEPPEPREAEDDDGRDSVRAQWDDPWEQEWEQQSSRTSGSWRWQGWHSWNSWDRTWNWKDSEVTDGPEYT